MLGGKYFKRSAKASKSGLSGYYYQKDLKDSPKAVSMQPFDKYYEDLKQLGLVDFDNIRNSEISIHYDSLSGSGEKYFPRILEKEGIPVKEILTGKDEIEGPEPKEENLFNLRQSIKDDTSPLKIGLANDGDADRFGIVDSNGEFIDANEVLLLTAYHLSKNKNKKGAIVKNQVTTTLIDDYAKAHGIKSFTTPVGFKFLAGEIMNERNKGRDIILAGEESGGMTVAGHIPEKDGIIAVLLMADLMAQEGKPLTDILNDIKSELNAHYDSFASATILNSDAEKERIMKKMENIYDLGVNHGQTDIISGFEIDVEKTIAHYDNMVHYKGDSDGVKLFFTDKTSILVRKSGTEPKLRVHIETQGDTDAQAQKKCEKARQTIEKIIGF